LEEIWEYIQKKFDPSLVGEISIDIKGDGSMMTLYAYHEGRILLEKRVLFLVNKYDLVNDEDILKEYLTQLKDQIILFLKKKKARLPSDKENVGGQV